MNCPGTGKLATPRLPQNRADCPKCGRSMTVNQDGRIRAHWAEVSLWVHLSHDEREQLVRAAGYGLLAMPEIFGKKCRHALKSAIAKIEGKESR